MEQLADRKKAWVSGLLMQVASKTGNGAEKERLPEVGSALQEDKDIHS